ncbi:phage integrase family protein [Lachnotalea glycerini]|uniref:Phage integrase family protein n=1 Tax=Lachnotalea glycerini TaxID=1763509 RepID=A0A255ITB4_9FIRM|nr:site-specific integrase [Lachnotalea glycerini]PXV93408.1 phage integrase family protein [Lachnotalea glycerini]RDY31872.1 site-specific integrase [Lachnotalea glycerini]
MSRRGENIYKRKDGRWEGRLMKQDKKYQYFYARTYKEVKGKMKLFLEQKDFSKKGQSDQLNHAPKLFEAWLVGEISLRVKPSTYESYYCCMHRHVIPFFSESENNKITQDSIAGFVRMVKEKQELAEASKKKILAIFKISLKEILKDSPECHFLIDLVRLPKTEDKEVQVFSMKEQRLIVDAALHSQDRRAIGIVVCFYTGIRLGELCALKWSDIDIETGTMSIMRTVSRTRIFEEEPYKTVLLVGTPKSRKSVRKIPLPAFLLKLINESIECDFNHEYIFSGKDVPSDPRSYQKLFKKILKELKLQERKFHAIRHTFATRALELGVDIKTLSEILGHSSVSITLDIYAHSLMEQKKVAIEKFNDMYMLNVKQNA